MSRQLEALVDEVLDLHREVVEMRAVAEYTELLSLGERARLEGVEAQARYMVLRALRRRTVDALLAGMAFGAGLVAVGAVVGTVLRWCLS